MLNLIDMNAQFIDMNAQYNKWKLRNLLSATAKEGGGEKSAICHVSS